MKIPGRIQSYLDELGLDGGDKAKVKRYIADMGDALPEHPSPKEVEKIVKAAMKSQKVAPGGSDDSDAEDAPKPKKKVEKSEKVEKADKVKVEESKKPLSFKAFITEASAIQFRIEDSDLEEYADGIQFDLKLAKMPASLAAKIKALNIDEDYFSEDGFTIITLENKNKEKLKKLFIELGYVEVKKFNESASTKMFKIKWVSGYGSNNGKSETHPQDWFTDDMGFEADDIKKMDELTVGEGMSVGGFSDSAKVTRTK